MVSYKDLGLVNTREMFAKAIKGGYAVPAFNFNNMEQLQAIVMAAAETKSPVILQVSKGARNYANQTLLRYMAEGAVEYAKELGWAKPQIDTHNILFICGGAFDGLEKIIEQRTDRKGIGFDAVVESKAERRTGQLLKEVQPHDLLKFGIIPELVGRMPVMVTLNGLGRDDLVQILTQPKNALVKQYQKLLEYDDVELVFQPEALDAVADQAIQRNIGARGLRAVMEGLLTKIMYEIPSDPTITRVTITPEAVLKTGEPEITRDPQRTERPGRTRDGKAEHDPSAPAS